MKFIGIPDELTNLGCVSEFKQLQSGTATAGNSPQSASRTAPLREGNQIRGKQEHRINAYPHVA